MAQQPIALNSLSRDLYKSCAEGQVLVKDSTTPSGTAPADNGGGGNPFDQDLNTTDSPQHAGLTITGVLNIGPTSEGQLYASGADFLILSTANTQLTPAGGTVTVNGILGAESITTPTFNPSSTFQVNAGAVDADILLLADGAFGAITLTATDGIGLNGAVNVTGPVSASGYTASAMPTADPVVAGQFWNDTGTVKISAG